MNIEDARLFALSMPAATEDMPFGDDGVMFRLGGKGFMYIPLDSTAPRIVVKLPPEMGLELREQYEAVQPAWHWNKKHWNDIYLNHDEPSEQQIKQYIKCSYTLVRDKLPRRIKSTLPLCEKDVNA